MSDKIVGMFKEGGLESIRSETVIISSSTTKFGGNGCNFVGSNKLRFFSCNCCFFCGVLFGDDFLLLYDLSNFALKPTDSMCKLQKLITLLTHPQVSTSSDCIVDILHRQND